MAKLKSSKRYKGEWIQPGRMGGKDVYSIHRLNMTFNTLKQAKAYINSMTRKKNPAGTWFKLDHPHAIAVVDDEVRLMSSRPLTNPQRKRFRAFVSKLKKALSNKRK